MRPSAWRIRFAPEMIVQTIATIMPQYSFQEFAVTAYLIGLAFMALLAVVISESFE